MTITGQRVDEQATRVTPTPISLCNAVGRVSHLPTEILTQIFLYCARRDYHDNWYDIGVFQWVNVSYVCSRWRYVALSLPTLWSYLFVASPRWTDALLIRSKKVPLWVHVYFTPINSETALDFMEQVVQHAERFRECLLDIQSMDAELVLPLLSSHSAPLLHTLAISCRLLHHWNNVDEDTQVDTPHTFFNGDTPALRELELNDSLITRCSPTLGGLTVLRLRDLHYSVQPTISELGVMLSRMPDLVELQLDDAIRGGRNDPVRLEAGKVQLPRLARLLIAAPFSRVVRFLSCIDIPVTTRVRLNCRLESHSDENDYVSFYAFLSQRFSNSEKATSVAPIRTMVMDHALQHMSIVLSNSEQKCTCQKYEISFYKDCNCDVPLKVYMSNPIHAENWNDLVIGICRSMPLARLKNLILTSCRLPSAIWFDIIWHLQDLRYIGLTGGDLSDLVMLLSLSPRPLPETADKPVDQCTSQFFAPSLEELCLGDVWVRRRMRCRGNPSMHGSAVMLFRDALARRSAARHALERLFINGHLSFTHNEVICLGQVVPQVEVHNSVMLLQDDKNDCEDCREEPAEEFGMDELFDDDSLNNVVPPL